MRRPRATALTSAFAVLASTLTFTGAAMVTTTTTASADVIQGAWSAVGSTFASGGKVYVLAQEATGTGTVYAGGFFTNAGGNASADYIASIDPSNSSADWQALTPTSLSAGSTYTGVYSIAPVAGSNTVFIGGNFNTSDATVEGVVSWDGNTSSNFERLTGGGVSLSSGDDGVEDLVAVDATTVYMVGGFDNAGSNANADNIALYIGGTWRAPTTVTTGNVNAIAYKDATTAAVGGPFYVGGSPSFGHVATWECNAVSTACATYNNYRSIAGDASTTLGFNPTSTTKTVAHLTYIGSDLYAGGNFTTSNAGTPVTLNGIAKWDGTSWDAVPSVGSGLSSGGIIETMAADGTTTLYVGGVFTSVNGVAANNIAKYDIVNGIWSSLSCGANNGVNGAVRGILPQADGSVIIGGHFTNAGGVSAADYVARYTPGADNCPAGSSSDAPDPAPSVTIDFDGNGGVCSPSSITADQGTWGKALTVEQCTYGSKTLAFFSTSPTTASGATNVAPGGNIYFSEPARFYAIWSSDKPSPVTDVVATPALNAVKVTWKPPVSDGGASLRDYCVVLRTQTNTVISAVCSRPDQPLEATVNLPATNSKYTFTVVARNSVGTSEPVAATPVSPYAIKNVVASRPDVLLGLGGTKVEASGDAPGLAGQSLNVQYKVGSAKWTTEANAVKVNAKSKFSWSKKIARASNNKNVTVRFTYGSDAVAGPYVLARGGETGDLSAPRNIKVNNSVNEVYVTWDPPKFDGGSNITGYVLCAIPSRGAKTCKDPSYTKAILWNLNTMGTYTITVAAKNAAGEGPEGKYAKTVDPTEASIRGVARSFDQLTADVRGDGFKKNSKFRVEIAIPIPGENSRTWNWDEVKSFKDDQPFFFRKTLQIPLDSRYSGERVLLRLVTPTGTVYSRSIRP